MWYVICNATLVWVLQAAEFGMVFAGDISDVMSDGEEQRRFEACEHKHTTSRFIIHLAKAELAVPFFYTNIHYIVYKIHQKASFFPHTTRNGKTHTIFFTSLQNFSVALHKFSHLRSSFYSYLAVFRTTPIDYSHWFLSVSHSSTLEDNEICSVSSNHFLTSS